MAVSAPPMPALRWAFAGCKPQGVAVLSALCDAGFVPAFCAIPPDLTQADDSAMRAVAARFGIPVYQSERLVEHAADLAVLDLLLVCRFALLPRDVFTAPRLGAVNIHSSLLPLYRGVHPVSWALINGEAETGVTMHRITAGVDTGPVVARQSVAIADTDDLWSLTGRLDAASAVCAAALFTELAGTGTLPPGIAQTGEPSRAPRRTPAQGRIDWHLPARSIFNLVRALPPPLPPAFCFAADGTRIAVSSARLSADRVSRSAPGTVLSTGPDAAGVICGDGCSLEIVVDAPLAVGQVLS